MTIKTMKANNLTKDIRSTIIYLWIYRYRSLLQLVLFDIKSITDREEHNCSRLEEECYRPSADVLEELFIPEKNSLFKNQLKESVIEDHDFFELARKCIVRVYESIELWTKEFGPEGYFRYIENFMGSEPLTTKSFVVESKYMK